MNSLSIRSLNAFISNHGKAWEAFEKRAGIDLRISDFVYVQERGSWVAVDTEGKNHYFRMYCDSVVAIISHCGNVVLAGNEYIAVAQNA